MDIPFLALVAHHQSWRKPHIPKHLIQVPCHAKAGTATHPGVYIILEAIIELLRGSGTSRGFQTNNLRQVLVGNFGQLITDVLNLFPQFGLHGSNVEITTRKLMLNQVQHD